MSSSSSWVGDDAHAPTATTKTTHCVLICRLKSGATRMYVPGQWGFKPTRLAIPLPPQTHTHTHTHMHPRPKVRCTGPCGTVWYHMTRYTTGQYMYLAQCVIKYTHHVEAVFALLLALVFVQQNLFRLRFIRSICLSGRAKAGGHTTPAVQRVLLTLLCARVEVETLVPAVEGCVLG